jgi:hypothetical protein
VDPRLSARIVLGDAEWEFPPGSPLAFLRAQRPLGSIRLLEAKLTFGF